MDTGALDLRDARAVIEIFDQAAGALRDSPLRAASTVRLPDRGRLVVTGDLHDQPQHFEKITYLADLEASDDHHLVLQEVIHGERLVNGMDFSHRMLANVAALVAARPQQVHPLLGNHELAQMTGRPVSKGAGNSVEQFSAALEYVYGDEADTVAEAIDRFVRAMPLALRSESGLFCAHSLPAPRLMDKFDPDVLERDLTDEDYRWGGGSAYMMVWGRGHTVEQVEALAARWEVKLFCLGHEHAPSGVEARGSRLVVINSDHDHGCALPVDLGAIPRAYEALELAVPLAAVGVREE